MMVLAALTVCAALLAIVPVAIIVARSAHGRIIVYGASLLASLTLLLIALTSLFAPPSTMALPLGLPWLGAHFRLDALSAFFLAVVNLGGAAASLYAIGYGAHETAPLRVLPFYPAFLAGMSLVVLADDAFSFLVSWEFMSLTSWALVMAHHRVADNARAGYIYLIMASAGTAALILTFGLLAGPDGGYTFAQMRAAHSDSGGAESCVRAHERRHDQGRSLWLRAHRLRPRRRTGLVVEHGRARARRHHRGDGRALCAHAARPQAAPRLSHGREHRDHLHRTGTCARVQGLWHAACRRTRAHRRPPARIQSFCVQEPALLRRRRRAQRHRRTRHGASRRPHPSHAADGIRVPGRLRRHLGAAAAQRLRVGMADVPGDPAQPAAPVLGPETDRAGSRGAAGALSRARCSLLRQGVRGDVSRPRAHPCG